MMMEKRSVVDHGDAGYHDMDKGKEKKLQRGVSESGLGVVGCGSQSQLASDLVFEICTRLPTKKVFQFRSVSKLWRSILCQPDFAEAHRKHHPMMALVAPVVEFDGGCPRQIFFFSTLRYRGSEAEGEQLSRCSINFSSSSRQEFTEIVKGLVCFHSRNDGVYISNIWTGEMVRLPNPPIHHGDKDAFPSRRVFSNCAFGFEPFQGVYKLLRCTEIHNTRSSQPSFECEILTLGIDSSWRKLELAIADAPWAVPARFRKCSPGGTLEDAPWAAAARYRSFHVHGKMFWTHENVLISFNLKEEKFCATIQLPYLALDGYRRLGRYFGHYKLMQFRGRLSLFLRSPIGENLLLYVLEGNEGNHWAEHCARLPEELQPSKGCNEFVSVPMGSLSTGEILLVNHETENNGGSLALIFSYNHEKNRFDKFFVGYEFMKLLLQMLRQGSYFQACCTEINFAPVNVLIRGGGI